MPFNRVNATLNSAQIAEIQTALGNIYANLPFLIDLKPEERQAMLKFGEKNRSFVVKAATVAEQNPDILPRNFNLDDSEAYSAALLVYQYAKTANVATGVLENALNDLVHRFASRTHRLRCVPPELWADTSPMPTGLPRAANQCRWYAHPTRQLTGLLAKIIAFAISPKVMLF
ncbi:MAG: hypothetical protein WCI11_16050 [Candidatus Methylumidiphilus sp.]